MERSPAPDGQSRDGPVEFSLSDVPANPRGAGAVRRALTAWLDITAFDSARIVDIGLAVYEAMANAVEHAYSHAGGVGTMTLRAAYSMPARTLSIEVRDVGRWLASDPGPSRGNGLPLISALSGTSTVEHGQSGTAVTMTWNVETPPNAVAAKAG